MPPRPPECSWLRYNLVDNSHAGSGEGIGRRAERQMAQGSLRCLTLLGQSRYNLRRRESGVLTMPKTRQHRTIGAILKVPLDDRWHTYAQTLDHSDFAFFDARTDRELAVEDIVSRPVLFREAVHKSAWTTGRWKRIGKAPLSVELAQPIPTFIQDPLRPDRFEIYLSGIIRPAERKECEGLRRCAVWDPNHIEDRLRDYYAGTKNKWVESLRLRK